jgi:hypothetical protein
MVMQWTVNPPPLWHDWFDPSILHQVLIQRSSRGLGLPPFTWATRIRIPYAVPVLKSSNAAGLVLRPALKTGFSVMGMGFDSSATRQSFKVSWMSGLNRHPAKVLTLVTPGSVGSNPTLTAKDLLL